MLATFPALGASTTIPAGSFVNAKAAGKNQIKAIERAQIKMIQDMYENDPVLQAPIAQLLNLLANADVTARVESEDGNAADGSEASDVANKYASKVYPPLIEPILRSILMFGFVAFRFVRSSKSKLIVPHVVHEDLFVPGIKIFDDLSYTYVALSEKGKDIDPNIFVIGVGTPQLNGKVTSKCSRLLSEWLKSIVIKDFSMKMDKLSSQYMIVCEKTAPASKDETQYSMFSDADKFQMNEAMKYITNESNVERFEDHKQHQKEILGQERLLPPELFPLPDGYKSAPFHHATARTDINAIESNRRALVLATLGVPESLVFGSGGQHTANVVGAYRTMNATLSQLQNDIKKIIDAVHRKMYPDSELEFFMEVRGLISEENLDRAYQEDIITAEGYARSFLETTHIPIDIMNPEVKNRKFKLMKLEERLKLEAKYAKQASSDGAGGSKSSESKSSSSSSSSSSKDKSKDSDKSKSNSSSSDKKKSDVTGSKRKSSEESTAKQSKSDSIGSTGTKIDGKGGSSTADKISKKMKPGTS